MGSSDGAVPIGPAGLFGSLLTTMSLVTAVVTWTPHGLDAVIGLNYGYASVATGLGLSGAALVGALLGGTWLGRERSASGAGDRAVRILTPIATVTCLSLYLAVFAPLSRVLYPLAIGVAIAAGVVSGWVD